MSVLTATLSARAADKSGVSPTSISIPSGPGSIEGLGAEFQPNLSTGTANYSIPIPLPPGTAGKTMELSLSYQGGSGNGPLGIGWSLSISSIRRQCDKGIPHYDPNGRDDDFDGLTDELDEQDRFLDPVGEELVLTAGGIYFAENQGQFLRYRYITDGTSDHWQARQPDGTLVKYGTTAAARVYQDGRICRWCLESRTDTNGNQVEFRYVEFPGSDQQKYIREIRYGPGAPPWDTCYFVFFEYEDRPDVIDDYRSGFLVRTGKRLARIDVAIQGSLPDGHLVGDVNSDGTLDGLIRRYELRYDAHPHWSLLTRVTQVGAGGTSTFASTRLDCQIRELPRVVSAANAVLAGQNEPTKVFDNDFVDIIDLNADGLPDILKTELSGSHTAYLNEGVRDNASQQVIQWGFAQQVDSSDSGGQAWKYDLADDEVSLVDMDGDGLADLVFNPSQDPNPRYYRNKGNVAWGAQELMAAQGVVPPAPFGDADVRTVDVNFDKRMDIVESIPNGYQVWYTLGKRVSQGAEYSRMILTPGAQHDGLIIQFSDSGVRLADLNGDRIVDVARIRPMQVIFVPSRGYGEYADSVEMPIPADDGFGHDAGFSSLTDGPDGQIERASLQDMNGDGLADLVVERAAFRELWYWINLGNRTFSQRHIVTDLPSNFTTITPSVRWADMNGNGTKDLVYADSGLGDGQRMRIVDVGVLVNGSPCPNLLTSIDNGIGKTTEVEYRPSTAFAVDDLIAGRPWTNPVPNPTHLITGITVHDGLGHDYVSEFRYHDGYYDGVEKEFRGFAGAERIDIGDQSQPTLVTEYSFDVGNTEESLKGKPLRVVTRTEEGKVFTEKQSTWATRRLFTVSPEPEDPLAPLGVTFPYEATQVEIVREELGGATQPIILEIENAYDDYGNLVMNAEYGRVDGPNRSFGEDERITWTVYSATPESLLWNVPIESVVTDNSSPPRVASHSQSFYDGPHFLGLPLGHVTKGNLMRNRDWVGPRNPPNPPEPLPEPATRVISVTENADHTLALTIQDASGIPVSPDQDYWVDSTRFGYDAYGNPTASADPLAQITSGTPDLALGHFRETIYDGALHSYVTEERVYTGEGRSLTMRVDYDLGFGTITDSWDFNGNHTQFTYDPFSRLLSIVKPGGSPPDSPEMPTTVYEYVLVAPVSIADGSGVVNWIETRQHEEYGDPDAYYVSRTFIDGLGRTVMIKEEDEQEDRTVVREATTFNERLLAYQTLLPFYSGKGLEFEAIDAADWMGTWIIEGEPRSLGLVDAPSNEVSYDAVGREIRNVQPDGTSIQTDYFPLARRISDEEDTQPDSTYFGTAAVLTTDGLERLIRVDEEVRLNDDGTPRPSPVVWSTHYAYDLLDDLIEVTDSQGNRKRMRYDATQRRLYMDDPDLGRMWNVFDDASNLLESVDAKGQRITCTYDGINRLLTEDYHDEGLPFSFERTYDSSLPLSATNQPDVAYYYDIPAATVELGDGRIGTATNTKGFLAYVVDLAGEEHFSYDKRGLIAWRLKRIPDPKHGGLVSYKTELSYDALDRITRHIYPDGDLVQHVYNARSLLEQTVGGATVHLNGNPNVIDQVDYVPSGLLHRCKYGNGIVTEYQYDRRLRRTGLKTAKETEPATPMIHYRYTFDRASNIVRIDDLCLDAQRPASDPVRNTQIFDYDDLYRLIRVSYSFAPPGSADRSDGRIDFRYDRIGNMLSKTSDIDHLENGHSVTNPGDLFYGGDAGAWGRVGRIPPSEIGDPQSAGPHALTSTSSGRVYLYDANGNLSELGGMHYTWDFKNRLVAVEDERVRAEYTYDNSDRRIIRKIWNLSDGSPSEVLPSASTLYIDKQFEVREHDQPVKYVWNGGTRVARITGSLDASAERVQRLRVFEGWNLHSLAVSATDAAGQLWRDPSVRSIYRWNAQMQDYVTVHPEDPLPSGSVFWIQAVEDTTIAVHGGYVDSENTPLSAGESFLPAPGLEAVALDDALPSASETVWAYDADAQAWRARLPGDLGVLLDRPEFLAPGEAIYVQITDASSVFKVPPSTRRIQYYHCDHLSSTEVVADAAGELLSNTSYYPFGFHRHEYNAAQSEVDYCFSGKERDEESGLHYFEARFYGSDSAHFLSVDPAATQMSEGESDPQRLNPYAYSLNRPLVCVDPTGNQSDVDYELLEIVGALADNVTTAAAKAADALTFGLSTEIFGEPEKLEYAMRGPAGAYSVPVDTPENNEKLLRNTGRAYGGVMTAGAGEALIGTVMNRVAARIKSGAAAAEVANAASRGAPKVATGGAQYGQVRSTFKTTNGVTINLRDAPVTSFRTSTGVTVNVRGAPAPRTMPFSADPRLERIATEMLGLRAGGSTAAEGTLLIMAQEGERATVAQLHRQFLRAHAGAARAGNIELAQSAQLLADISSSLGLP